MKRSWSLLAASVAFAACGGNALVSMTDGGPGSGPSSGNAGSSGGGSPTADASSGGSGGGSGGDSDGGVQIGPDTGFGGDSATPSPDAGTGGAPVDAGYYYGDGSFWVDGGAYPSLPDAAGEGGVDAGSSDASTGCGALAACCGTLASGSSQTLCNTIAASGDTTNCSTELSQLQALGNCTGVTILASEVQVAPNLMVSDGALLFWTVVGPGLYAMPVGGGPITTLSTEEMVSSTWAAFLAVDSVNVYVLEGNSLVRFPKDGSPATLVNEVGATVQCATSLGGTAYWFEGEEGPVDASVARSSPLLGTVISTLGAFPPGSPNQFAVTSSTGFVGFTGSLFSFPITGVPASGPTAIGTACSFVASDSNAVYCAETTGSNLIIANDGSTSSLGPAVNSAFMVSDDTYVYWVDATTVGTIMRAPKTGGGGATVLAYDTSPTAIAVDANSVYWSDQGGYIKSIPK